MHIIIASVNSEKARQLKDLLLETFQERARISTLFDKTISKDQELLENLKKELVSLVASTPSGLAEKKAHLVANALQTFALAEETLLTIPLLGNEDDAFLSKTASTIHVNPIKLPQISFTNLQYNTQAILNLLLPHEDPFSRGACISSFLSLSAPKAHIQTTVSRMEGYISEVERGKRTFEYGSIFIKYEYSKTLSELPESVLTRISHRKNGIERLYNTLKQGGYFVPSIAMRAQDFGPIL